MPGRFHSKFCRCLVTGVMLLLATLPAWGQSSSGVTLKFVDDNAAAFDPSNTYIVFSQGDGVPYQNFNATYNDGNGTENITLSSGVIGGSYVSPAYKLSDFGSNGVTLFSGDSIVAYVSYGAPVDFSSGAPSPTNPSPTDPNIATRWQTLEWTMVVNGSSTSDYVNGANMSGSNMDLTAINEISIPMQISQQSTNTTLGFKNGTTWTSLQQDLANAGVPNLAFMGPKTGTPSVPEPITPGDYNSTVRVIAPDSFASAGTTPFYPPGPSQYTTNPNSGYGIGPYTSFQSALGTLQDNMANHGQTVPLTGTRGYNGDYEGNPATIHYTYTFNPVITNATANTNTSGNASGNYIITFTGNITTNGTYTTSDNITHNITPYTFSNLTITMAPDEVNSPGNYNMEMSAAIYGQQFTIGNVQGNYSSGTMFSSNWDDLNTYETGAGNLANAFEQNVMGDFTEEMLLGLLFNPDTMNISSGNLFGQGSTYSDQAYMNLTTGGYSAYGNIIWKESNGTIYGNPYDDRFGAVSLVVGNATSDTWTVTLLPDTAPIPEPADAALLMAGAALLLAAVAARRRRARPLDPAPVTRSG